MKKIALLGICLLCGTGCGRGWLPRLFHGAPCMGSQCMVAPLAAPCHACPPPTTGAQYGSYDSYGPTIGGEQIFGSGIGSDGAAYSSEPGSIGIQQMETVTPPPSTSGK